MSTPEKKRDKTELKRRKKAEKAAAKAGKSSTDANANLAAESQSAAEPSAEKSSPAVRFSSYVRGGLGILTGLSIVVALVLGQSEAVVSLDDIFQNLATATLGKVLLAVIAAALIIHGLKKLTILR